MAKPLPVSPQELQDIPLFQPLSVVQLKMLSALMERASFLNNQSLLAVDDPAQRVYFLQSGTVKVCLAMLKPQGEASGSKDAPNAPDAEDGTDEHPETGSQVVLNLCGPGEILGEMSCLDHLGHSADVVAIEPCRSLWIDAEAFRECVHQMPALALALLHNTQRRFRFATRLLQAHSMFDATGRVAFLLLLFAERYGQQTPEGVLIPLRILQRDLADMVGISRPRANLALSTLREIGTVDNVKGGYFLIRDREHLRQRCS